MKKVLKTLLILAMLCALVLTLSGCGKEEENKEENNQNIENNESVENSSEMNFSRGEWQGNQYVNEFAKIKFNLPEGWSKATDEEIAELMNIGVEALNEEQQKLAEIAEQNTIYGMVANDPSTAASVMITLEKPTLKVTPEYYLSSVKQQLENLNSMEYIVGDAYTTTIGTEEYNAMDAEISGYLAYQHYYVKAVENYIVGIIVTTTEEDQVTEIMNCFE